jgi:hypothetical protein
MSAHARIPSCRSLDIYRLVVARGVKQATVAEWFNVTPARISQLVSRVRAWVNQSIGDWLFPGRDDLRFYVALECEKIRVEESPDHPENVVLTSPTWTYTRRITPTRSVSEGCNSPHRSASEGHDGDTSYDSITPQTSTNIITNTGLNISAEPLNSPPSVHGTPMDATPFVPTDFIPPHIEEMALRLAQLLMLWKKTRKVSSCVRAPSA